MITGAITHPLMKPKISQASKRSVVPPMSVPPPPLHMTRTLLLAGVLLPALATSPARAAELGPSTPRGVNDWFGYSVSISGDTVYVGAPLDDELGMNSGTVFVFRNISTANGTLTENARLHSTGEIENDNFGQAVSLSGENGYVTALQGDYKQGSSFAIFNIDSATPTQLKLAPSSTPFVRRWLGASASLSGNAALVGTYSEFSFKTGEAYLYRNIDSTVVETRLTSSDGSDYRGRYGESVALAGDIALVGSPGVGSNGIPTGVIYMYRNLDSATPVQTRIAPFDPDAARYFGGSVSLSGTTALVGARGLGGGAAYVIRNLDSTQVQTKLMSSDLSVYDEFGTAVSLSGNTALVGASSALTTAPGRPGAAYLFLNANSGGADATVTEDLKLFASNGTSSDKFGFSVSIDGDNFVIGAYGYNSASGGAYTGSVSSMTTVDTGNTTRTVDALSFVSKGDWTIGQTTDANIVQLTSGDTANVTAADKAVYIGRNAGSDNNTLIVSGTLAANAVHIGALAGNAGNKLQIGDGGTTGSVAGDIINHGNLTFNRSDSSQHGNVISGTGTVTKSGPGTITLTATSTYSGLTSVNGGKLVVNGSIASSAVAINNGGTLGGYGTVGAVTIASGGTISPGNSPGILNTGDETWSGGSYLWELNSATGAAGTNWDTLNITGTLSLEALATNAPFSIMITSLGLNNNPGEAANFDPAQNYSWILATASSGVTGFSADKFFIDTSGFLNLPGSGGFTVSHSGNDVLLNFAAVPEPSTLVMLGCALGGLTLPRRRDRCLGN